MLVMMVLASGAGCSQAAGTSWAEERVWTSAHFVVHARVDDASMSAKALDYLEANAALIAQGQLGLNPSMWGPVQYYKYRDEADFKASSPCPAGTGACNMNYGDGRVELHSPLAVDEHELVHSYAASLGRPPPFLTEGLAVSLSCNPSVESEYGVVDKSRFPLKSSWTSVYDLSDPTDRVSYVEAGMLTTWLVDHVGMATVLRWYQSVSSGAAAAEFATAAQTDIGTSLDDVWSALSKAPSRRPCLNVSSCTVSDPSVDATARSAPAENVPRILPPLPETAAPLVPGVRACSIDSQMSTDMGWPVGAGVASGAPSAVFLPNRDGYVLSSTLASVLRGDNWNAAGVTAPIDYASTPLAPSAVSATCMGLDAIVVQDSQASLQVWPRMDPFVFRLQSAQAQSGLSLVTAYLADYDDVSQPSSFMVDVCADCQAGALVGCKTIDASFGTAAPGVAAPWIRVNWASSDSNQLLTITADF